MHVDPRFELKTVEEGRGSALRFHAREATEIRELAPVLARLSFEELCRLGALPEAAVASFRDRAASTLLVNGWQSWSYAGELGRGESLRSSLLGRFNLFNERPGGRRRSGEHLSQFFAVYRSGERRLVVLSRNTGGAPLSLRIRKSDLGLAVEAYAEGARYEAGALVAELLVFYAEDYFATKDGFHAAFRGFGHFDRLAFLGHGATLVPGGYESWYNHYTAIDEGIIGSDLDSIDANANLINEYYIKRGKPTVFQIDDGWERAVGEWTADEKKFPGGMAAIAERIEAKGLIPGLWLAPFLVTKSSAIWRERPEWLLRDGGGKPVLAGWNPGWDGNFYCFDLSLPEVGDYLDSVFERVVEDWGYRYLKLDFLYAGMLRGARAKGGAAFEHYERVVKRITSRLKTKRGKPVAWLGCGAPLESSFRHFPLMRIGADTREIWEWPILKTLRHQGRPSAYTNLSHTVGSAFLDGTVFVNDPDVVFCREKGMDYGEREKELIALTGFLLASQIMFSDNTHEFGAPGERAFTARIVSLFDRLAGGEYGAERIAKDLFRLFSRDGRVVGWINLGDGAARIAGPEAARAAGKEALVFRGEARGGEFRLEPHSISIFSA